MIVKQPRDSESQIVRAQLRSPRPPQQSAGGGFTARDLMKVIRRRKLMIILSTVISAAVVSIATFIWQQTAPFYSAEALLEVTPPVPTVFTSSPFTNKDILESEKMSKLQLVLDEQVLNAASINNDLRKTSWYQASPSDEVVERLKKDLDVTSVQGTMFIKVAMRGTRKDELPVIVNAVCDAFVKQMKEAANRQTNDLIANLQKEQARLNRDLTDLMTEKAKIRKGNKQSDDAPGLEDQLSVLNAQQRTLTTTIAQLNQLSAEAQAALAGIMAQRDSGELARNPEVKYYVDNDPTLRGLRTQQINIETRLQALLKKFGPDHQMVKDLKAQLEEVIAKADALEQELVKENETRVIRSAEQNAEAVKARLVSVQETYKDVMTLTIDLQKKLEQVEAMKTKQLLLEDKIERIEKRLLELQLLSNSEEPVKLRMRAYEPKTISMPKWSIMIPLGILLGLIIGLGMAFLLEFIDTSIRSPSDIARRIDLPMLGMVPHVDDLTEDIPDMRLAFLTNPMSLVGEAFRQIRTCMLFSGPASQRRSVLVTSPLPEDGRSTVSLNMAASFAHSGRRVLVVDTNFRQPVINKLFPAVPGEGLSSALVGRVNWRDVVHNIEPNLDVMSAGLLPPNPAELLGSDQMRQMISEMTEQYDQVIFDGTPSLVVSDAPVLSTLVDGVVLVVRAGASTHGVVQRVRDVLDRVGAHIIGVVLNGMRVTAGGYLRKNYDTFYEYHEQSKLPSVSDEVEEALIAADRSDGKAGPPEFGPKDEKE